MKNILFNFLKDEKGASLAEYGLLVGLIAVVAIATMTSLGTSITEKFKSITTALGGK